MTAMTIEQIVKKLPMRPRKGMADAAQHRPELGPEFSTYKRVSRAYADACSIDVGWPLDDVEPAKGWAAECHCGVCGETWYAGYRRERGISLIIGEDDIPYCGLADEYDEMAVPIDEGETLECPMCGAETTLIHAKELRAGRTYRLKIGSVENVERYTVVVSWMAERCVFPDGSSDCGCYPEYAAVIKDKGLDFYHYADGVWKHRTSNTDPFQLFYHTHGGVPNRTVGAWLWGDVPDQTGQTGEKTGLAEYFQSDCRWPIMYYRLWRAYPSIENIVKAGWLEPFEEAIDTEVLNNLQTMLNYCDRGRLYAPKDCMSLLTDCDAVKPHEMLGMTREEVREGRSWHWSAEKLDLWVGLVISGIAAPGEAAAYNGYFKKYRLAGMQKWAEAASENRVPPMDKLDRYIDRQLKRSARSAPVLMEYYLDYLDMLGNPNPTPEQEFPQHLEAAHDRMVVMHTAAIKGGRKEEFAAVREKWHELEYSDGSICAVLPRCADDLRDEGNKLCHCVGGYVDKHLQGSLIVFIRHARRPERSWYTLNIDVSGKTWHEVQLHGYGNEYAHGQELHIPKAVREWIDRWEAEVLQPAFARVKIAERKQGKETKKKAGAA